MIVKEKTFLIGEKELLLRSAMPEDAAMILTYLKKTAEESKFLLREPDEAAAMTLAEEEAFLLAQNRSPQDVMLVGILDGTYVGNCSYSGLGSRRVRHRATAAIALYQKYTGMGIGQKMFEHLFSVAAENGFEQLELEVLRGNTGAVRFYERMGFQTNGVLPRYFKYADGSYDDALFMTKRL